jgi:hypothetical protein
MNIVEGRLVWRYVQIRRWGFGSIADSRVDRLGKELFVYKGKCQSSMDDRFK